MFGVVFPDRSLPMDASSFTQIDPLHWLLDMSLFVVGDAYLQVKQVCIFLLNNLSLPPDKAVAVYIQSHSSPFLFCGAVHAGRPSAVLTLPWPDPAEAAAAAQAPGSAPLMLTQQPAAATGAGALARIGISVVDLAALPPLVDAGEQVRVERLAMWVGENLFNFMQSFCGVDGSKLVVPMDILDRWFKKFQERARRDPEYLKGFTL